MFTGMSFFGKLKSTTTIRFSLSHTHCLSFSFSLLAEVAAAHTQSNVSPSATLRTFFFLSVSSFTLHSCVSTNNKTNNIWKATERRIYRWLQRAPVDKLSNDRTNNTLLIRLISSSLSLDYLRYILSVCTQTHTNTQQSCSCCGRAREIER